MRRACAAAALSLLAPLPCRAATAGFEPFYDGLQQPLLDMTALLPLVALATWAGLRGAAAARPVALLTPPAWFAGVLAGAMLGLPDWSVAGGAGLAVLLGVAAAADLALPGTILLGAGMALGLLRAASADGAGAGPAVALGAAVTVAALLLLIAGQVAALRGAGSRIGARVIGSWTAAAALLQLGWAFRGT